MLTRFDSASEPKEGKSAATTCWDLKARATLLFYIRKNANRHLKGK